MKDKIENSTSSNNDNKKEIHKSKFDCNTNTLLFLLILFLNILLISFSTVFIIYLFLTPHILQGRNIDGYSNNYCQKNRNGTYYNLICTNKYFKHEYKKKKFIWIMTDGTAYDQLVELHKLHKYRITTSFKVLGKNFKLTNELHQAIIVGKRNRNYFGANIDIDNILQQAINSNYKLNYRGWTYPMAGIIGENKGGLKENDFFYKKFIDDGKEFLNFHSFCNFTNPFPFLKLYFDTYQESDHLKRAYFNYSNKIKDLMHISTNNNYHLKKNISQDIFFEELDNFFIEHPIDLFNVNITNCLEKSFEWNPNENISILYYTTVLDHFNHLFGKKHGYTIMNTYLTEKMIFHLMKWIDKNSDYALIITTDHGGQEFYGEDFLRNHGEDSPGNEGIFYIYTKELKDFYDELNVKEKYIDIVDESAIIPQILYDINIPIYSEGIPYSIINDNIIAYSALKSKEIQLISFIESYIKKYGGKYKKLLNIKNQLNNSLSKFESFEKLYFNNQTNETNKQFQKIINENLEQIKHQQKEITRIIQRKNRTFKNIFIFVLILFFSLIKFLIEILYLKRQIYNYYFTSIPISKDRKRFHIIVLAITIFWLIIPFSIPYIFFWVNMNNKLAFLAFSAFICSFLNILMLYFIFKPKNIFDEKYENKIFTFAYVLFGIFFFSIFIHYSYAFHNIKEYYSRYGIGRNSNIIIIYPMFIGEIIYEMLKYKRLYFYFGGERKIKVIYVMIVINLLFLIFVFIQDMTANLYHSGQRLLNIIANFIAFILLLINIVISNFLLFTNFPLQHNLERKDDSDSQRALKNKNNLETEQIIEIQNLFNKDRKFNDITTSDFGILKDNITLFNEINPKSLNQICSVNGLPCIKLCLINLCFWLSDESERIYLILLLLPLLEYFDYLSDFFYTRLLDILFYPSQKYYSISARFNINNNGNTHNYNNNSFANSNTIIKIGKQTDKYIVSFVFFILTHNSFIHLNHIIFLLTQRSYEYCFSMRQEQKIIFARFLKSLIDYVGKYKFSFAIVGYIINRRNLIINKKIKNYTIVYTFPRILLYIRITFDLIFFSSYTLINVDNEFFIYLTILNFIDLFMAVVDFCGLIISKIIYFIYKLTLPNFEDIILVYSSIYNRDLLNENWKNKIY